MRGLSSVREPSPRIFFQGLVAEGLQAIAPSVPVSSAVRPQAMRLSTGSNRSWVWLVAIGIGLLMATPWAKPVPGDRNAESRTVLYANGGRGLNRRR